MATMLTKESQKILANVPEEYVFRVHDDGILRNLKELAEALNTLSDEIFSYHSNSEKKDFSNWVRDIIGDKRLAKELDGAATRYQAARAVQKRIAVLSK